MRTLNLYITRDFVFTFALAIGILTFCMVGGRLVKLFDHIANGLPVLDAALFIVYVLPTALSLTIPWALLVAIMLVFGRLSADNEITAMRACGISVLQIISPLIITTLLLTCVCVFLQLELGPKYFGMARSMGKQVAVDQPLALIRPGWPAQFENNYIYIREKVGKSGVKDIQIFRMDKDGERLSEDISAVNGEITVDKEKQVLHISLNDANISHYEKGSSGKSIKSPTGDGTTVEQDNSSTPRRTFSKHMTFSINYGKSFNRKVITKRVRFLDLKEMFGRTVLYKKLKLDTTKLEVELNQRIAMALMPIAFLLLGLPLAIRTSRRETSVGLFLSVILAGVYFGAVMICGNLHSMPQLYPQFLLWIPCVLYQIFGSYYIFKIARR